MIVRRTLTVRARGPLLTRANTVGGFGVDVPVARDEGGRPYLPGTLVLGRIAEALRDLGAAERAVGRKSLCHALLRDWFATGARVDDGACEDETSGDALEGRSSRRKIFVGDLAWVEHVEEAATDADENAAPRPDIRTRIRLDTETGSVAQGALQVIETPFLADEPVTFRGELRLVGAEDAAETKDALRLIETALAWITQWGALRSVGFGVVAKGDGTTLHAAPAHAPPAAPAADRLRLVLTLHDLVCVGGERVSQNTYRSGTSIPGGAIKGALAAQILAVAGKQSGSLEAADALGPAFAALARHFSALRVLHAVPVRRDAAVARPQPPPFSLVFDGDDRPADLALAPAPEDACLVAKAVPRYAPDWKGAHAAAAWTLVGWDPPKHTLRIRTQIDPARRSARESRLFGIEYLKTHEHVFVAEIDLGAVPGEERDAVRAGLAAALRDGLAGIGRGGAYASVTIEAAPPAPEPVWRDGRLVLVLRTPALLRDPRPGHRGDVTALYDEALRGLGLPAEARVRAVFVRERLAGAEFMAARFGARAYRPFLLTDAGSVLVIETKEKARPSEALADWARAHVASGVDVPPGTLKAYGLDPHDPDLWRVCPYLPQNGYAEIGAGARLVCGCDLHEIHAARDWTSVADRLLRPQAGAETPEATP